LFVVNFLPIFYLLDTTSFDYGFFSIQSIFYSINIYLLYFFISLETICSLLTSYGLDFSFYKLLVNNLDNLNFSYVIYILYQNINFFYYLIFSLGFLFFLEKKKYQINFKKNSLKTKKIILLTLVFIIFILSNFNPNLTHQGLLKRYKLLTNNWSYVDFINNYVKYYQQSVKNNFFRNDNWYYALKYSIFYSDTSSAGYENLSTVDKNNNLHNFKDFGKIIQKKKYNNIYVIINESYPNFRKQNLKNNLLKQITLNNENLIIRKYKKKWNKQLTTQGSEMEFFCNKEVDSEKYITAELKTFISDNKCWINSYKQKNLIYIHSFTENFFNRHRYKSFFDKTFFRKDLELLNFKTCSQQYSGICDYEILDNMDTLIESKNNNFVIFLTLNNHIPSEQFYKTPYIDCEKNFPLNLYEQFCYLYNNQMLFNKSLSKFLSKMGNDDILVFFSDTPPLFPNKLRIHFESIMDIYFFSKT